MSTKIGDRRHHLDDDSRFIAARSEYFERLEVFARTEHVKSYPVHPHDRWQLTWILSGTVDLVHRGGSTLLRAGDAVLAAPFEPLGGRAYCGIPIGFVTVQIPQEILQHWTPGRVVARTAFAAQCERLIERLIVARSGDEQAQALNDLAAQFLATGRGNSELAGPRGKPHPMVRAACDLLDESLSDKLPLEELAQAVHMNHRYVISVFKDGMGIPPHQYVIARRVESARVMVNQGRALNAVAADAGFNDQSHLTRQFKRTFGVTPGAYQARHCHMNFLQNFPSAAA
jgi:AraC-like DNA-binding protein/mannose-6-phosphate isomerase-like protein (cupin superfamily)